MYSLKGLEDLPATIKVPMRIRPGTKVIISTTLVPGPIPHWYFLMNGRLFFLVVHVGTHENLERIKSNNFSASQNGWAIMSGRAHSWIPNILWNFFLTEVSRGSPNLFFVFFIRDLLDAFCLTYCEIASYMGSNLNFCIDIEHTLTYHLWIFRNL